MKATAFLEKLKQIPQNKLENVKGIGQVLAANFNDFINSPRFQEIHQKFNTLETDQKGLEIITKLKVTGGSLYGLSICITGNFDLSREKIKEIIEKHGGKFVSQVTGKTSLLLVGIDPGSKLSKAENLGVKIYDDLQKFWDEFKIPVNSD